MDEYKTIEDLLRRYGDELTVSDASLRTHRNEVHRLDARITQLKSLVVGLNAALAAITELERVDGRFS